MAGGRCPAEYDLIIESVMQIARLTEDGSVEVASSAAHARTRVVVDHYAPDGSGSFTLGASSIDFCEYLAHSDVALHLVPSVAGDARKGRPPPRTGEQSTNEVLMVAPTAFGFNEQTAQDNHFMHVAPQAGATLDTKLLERHIDSFSASCERQTSF